MKTRLLKYLRKEYNIKIILSDINVGEYHDYRQVLYYYLCEIKFDAKEYDLCLKLQRQLILNHIESRRKYKFCFLITDLFYNI